MICTKARIILWFDCNRKCENCCNNYSSIIDTGEKITSFDGMEQYDEFLLTGGEPMLRPGELMDIIETLREKYPGKKIYLYTALWDEQLREIVKYLDGVHFTLHAPLKHNDHVGFQYIQSLAKHYIGKSFRLYIDPRIRDMLMIFPSAWKRLEVKPWLLEGECPLPPQEKLFIYKGD